MPKPFCFVLMPFGVKPDPSGRGEIDFDRVYSEAIAPAVAEADLEPVRADEEKLGGIIHKHMFERLMLCEFALADLTTANPNVFYELGVRHTARPRTTLAIFATHQPIPFDLKMVRAMPYDLGPGNGFGPTEAKELRANLVRRLSEVRAAARSSVDADSPVFQLLGADWAKHDLAHLKTDVFHERVQFNEKKKAEIAHARALARTDADAARAELERVEAELGSLETEEMGAIVDLMLGYRDAKAFTRMIELVERMPEILKRQVLIREQLAFALNRRAEREKRPHDRDEAERVLKALEVEQGSTSETCGLLGRVHKDRWRDDRNSGQKLRARGHLEDAIAAYRRGFEADWRDTYPGINACTLLEIQGDDAALREKDRLLPVVRYAAERRVSTSTGARESDYWDHATLLEAYVLEGDVVRAEACLGRVLAKARARWAVETTAANLRDIAKARADRGVDVEWLSAIIAELDRAAGTEGRPAPT